MSAHSILWPQCTSSFLKTSLLVVFAIHLMGCSSSEPEPVAQAPAALPSNQAANSRGDEDSSAADDGGETYGGGEYSQSGAGSSGPSGRSGRDDDEDMMGGMSLRPGMIQAAGPGQNPVFSDRGGGLDYPDSSMFGGGSGPGMSGFGMAGNATPQSSMAVQFIRQNCINCHGPQQTKGDVRLDRMADNFTDELSASTWDRVLTQLESNKMPPADVPQRPDPLQQRQVQDWIRTSLASSGFVPLEQRDYLAQATHAFEKGKEDVAVDLLYAHVLASDAEVAQETLSQAKWSEVGLRPTLTLRFAAAVVLDAADDITDLKPLGSTQSSGGIGRGGSSGESFSAPATSGAAASGERTFEQLTGDFGDALKTSFESRWMTGQLGTVFKDVVIDTPATSAANPAAGFAGSRSGGGMMFSGGVDEDRGGSFDSGFAGIAANNGPVSIVKGSRITPGLVFLGTGNQVALLAEAAEMGLDGVFMFDVKVSENRRRLVENSTRLRFMTPDGKTLAATSTLVNLDVERAKMRGHEDDSLSKGMERFFAMFDEKVKLSPLPALKPEHAHDRVRNLLVDKRTSDLAKLFETRLYYSLGLLTDDELSKVYQIVLRGNEGVALASGTLDDRKLVLSQLLNK